MSIGDSSSTIEEMIDNCGDADNVALAIVVLAREVNNLARNVAVAASELADALTRISNAIAP